MFLTSPRNSVAAQVNLFNTLKCNTLLTPRPWPPPVMEIVASYKIRVIEVPDINDLLQHVHPQFPYNVNYSERIDQPLFAV